MLSAILPTVTAVLGLMAGLLTPWFTDAVDSRKRRSENQRTQCEEILMLFQGADVVRTLVEPSSAVRRSLVLRAVRLQDERARQACQEVVEYAAGPQIQESELLDLWSAMIHEVARVYRSMA
jgi:hypothetical protein